MSPSEHQAPGAALKVARIYMRVSTEDQDLNRQDAIVESTKAAGFYIAGIYREKASGARADRAELLRWPDAAQVRSREFGRIINHWRGRPGRSVPCSKNLLRYKQK